MAINRLRLKKLTPEEQNLALTVYTPEQLDAWEKTGTIPTYTRTDQQGGNWGEQEQYLRQSGAMSRVPDRRSVLSEYITGLPKDYSTMSEAELQDALSAYQEGSGYSQGADIQSGKQNFVNNMLQQTKSWIKQTTGTDPTGQNWGGKGTEKGISGRVSEDAVKKGLEAVYDSRLKGVSDVRQVFAETVYNNSEGLEESDFDGLKKVGNQFQTNFSKDRILKEYPDINGQLPNYDYSSQISNVESILSEMKDKGASQTELDNFIGSLPVELSRGRDAYLAGEVDSGTQMYQEQLSPTIKQNLATRGMLRSGDLSNELARGAGEVAGALQDTALNLQSEDEKFFTDMAYKETFRKEIEAGNDISSNLNYERSNATQTQSNNFTSAQADLTQKYNEMIQRRTQDRELATYQSKLKKAQDLANSNSEAQTYGQIGSVLGQIGTSVALGKMNKGTTT
jgi:hypothetical protein